MQKLYEGCPGFGWNDKTKMRELQHENARFILCHNAEAKPVAFAHIRFMREGAGGVRKQDANILYVYDIARMSACGLIRS